MEDILPLRPAQELESPPSFKYRFIEVTFRQAGQLFLFSAHELAIQPQDRVIVQTEHGLALGYVKHVRETNQAPPPSLRVFPAIRRATPEDIRREEEQAKREEEAFRFCRERIEEHQLGMKLVRTEYLYSGSKMIFYFAAEGRIDFRLIVRDLARHFRMRIEMRQIGVRDSAKLVGGIGPCGQELCCSRFLRNFSPVSIRMAKDQGLALNPQKVSGACGRLMCCLAYEQSIYKQQRRLLPKIGRSVQTPEGEGKVREVSPLRQMIHVVFLDRDPPEEKEFHISQLPEFAEAHALDQEIKHQPVTPRKDIDIAQYDNFDERERQRPRARRGIEPLMEPRDLPPLLPPRDDGDDFLPDRDYTAHAAKRGITRRTIRPHQERRTRPEATERSSRHEGTERNTRPEGTERRPRPTRYPNTEGRDTSPVKTSEEAQGIVSTEESAAKPTKPRERRPSFEQRERRTLLDPSEHTFAPSEYADLRGYSHESLPAVEIEETPSPPREARLEEPTPRRERPERRSPRERPERPERAERPERPERPDTSERSESSERRERAERAERPERRESFSRERRSFQENRPRQDEESASEKGRDIEERTSARPLRSHDALPAVDTQNPAERRPSDGLNTRPNQERSHRSDPRPPRRGGEVSQKEEGRGSRKGAEAHQKEEGRGFRRGAEAHQKEEGRGFRRGAEAHQKEEGRGFRKGAEAHQKEEGRSFRKGAEAPQAEEGRQKTERPEGEARFSPRHERPPRHRHPARGQEDASSAKDGATEQEAQPQHPNRRPFRGDRSRHPQAEREPHPSALTSHQHPSALTSHTEYNPANNPHHSRQPALTSHRDRAKPNHPPDRAAEPPSQGQGERPPAHPRHRRGRRDDHKK